MVDKKLTELNQNTSPLRGDLIYSVLTNVENPLSRSVPIENLLIGDAKFVAANNSSDEAKKQADYVCDGISDHVEINAALAELPSGGILILSIGTFNLTVMLAMLDDQQLIGSGWGTILNVATSTVSILTMGDRCKLSDIKVLGDIAPLTNDFKKIVSGDDCLIRNIWIDQNDYGIETVGKKNIYLEVCKFTNIKATSGWSACIHASTGTDGVFVNGVYMEDCHRGFEVENGAKNFYAQNGYLKTVRNSIVGGGTNVLDVHTHGGAGGVKNVIYENFYLEDCDAITARGSGADRSKNITFKNITMKDPVLGNTFGAIHIATADQVFVENVKIEGLNDQDTITVTDSTDVLVNRVYVENVLASILLLGAGSERVTFRECQFINTGAAAGVQIRRNSGDCYDILFDKSYVFTNASPAIRVFTNIHRLKIERTIVDANGFNYGIDVNDGADDVDIVSNTILNATLNSIRTNQERGHITRNYLDEDLFVTANASDVWIYNNWFNENGISDAGTRTRIFNNYTVTDDAAFLSGQGQIWAWSVANVTNPPTDAEIDAIFGTPRDVGSGFMGIIDDADGDANQWLVLSNNKSWWYTAMTKAV